MNTLNLIWICLVFLLNVRWIPAQPLADKVALLIAISEYSPKSGWNKINGENDLPLISEALLSRGFKQENIKILKGNAVTKANIRKQIKRLSKMLQPGGFFVFHFSGHGQQVEDAAPLQDEIDNLDEALVLYDAPRSNPDQRYDGRHHLIDDQMSQILFPIRQQLGKTGQVLILLDACHSGTGTRVGEQERSIRGTKEILKLPKSKKTASNEKKENYGFLDHNVNPSIAPCILISATRSRELNQEYFIDGHYYGPLSYAFNSVFKNLPPNSNYQYLFELVRNEMLTLTTNQLPTIEGNIEIVVGQNKLLPAHLYFSIIQQNNQEVLIDGGLLSGIHDGKLLKYYPATIDTTGQLIGSGEVFHTVFFKAYATINLRPEKVREKISRAYVSDQRAGYQRFSINSILDDVHLKDEEYKLTASLIPVRLELDEDNNIVTSERIPKQQLTHSKNGVLNIPLGTFYQWEITNHGDKTAYLSMLDIQPDENISVAIPFKYPVNGTFLQPQDYVVYSGEKKILKDHFWQMAPPIGMEQFVIIGTDQPFDVRKHLYGNRTRNQLLSPLVPSAVHIEKLYIKIVE